jgi:hypothetical protein
LGAQERDRQSIEVSTNKKYKSLLSMGFFPGQPSSIYSKLQFDVIVKVDMSNSSDVMPLWKEPDL